ncbi:hypothetical protein RUM43_004595 [Polyplax serrata]|uniref:Uncharacterized protein n=1 Tax=Polyplax serrata TaxID=468196 RepID=A0AAN8XQ55_POLSC
MTPVLQHGHYEDDVLECVDWQLPLSFVKKRHAENIEGETAITQTWRMKERVSGEVNCSRENNLDNHRKKISTVPKCI